MSRPIEVHRSPEPVEGRLAARRPFDAACGVAQDRLRQARGYGLFLQFEV